MDIVFCDIQINFNTHTKVYYDTRCVTNFFFITCSQLSILVYYFVFYGSFYLSVNLAHFSFYLIFDTDTEKAHSF